MQNITYTVKGNTLTIVVKLDGPTTLSSTGKSMIVASTQGNVPVSPEHGSMRLGVNVFRAAPQA